LAQLYPKALGSLSVAFYNSQGCGGGILTHLHMKRSERLTMVKCPEGTVTKVLIIIVF
jgi:hypothetical protein